MALKITKAVVESLTPKAARYVTWDTAVPGFGVVVQPSGRKSFALFYRSRDGTQRKPSLGVFGSMTVEQARELARDMLAKVRGGEDPSLSRKMARASSTVGELADRYLDEYARPRKKASSVKMDELNLKKHVRPRFGSRKVTSMTAPDIQSMHHAMHETPGAANRTVALLSKMFNLAEKWGLRAQGTNPCAHIERYPEKKIHRDLTEIETARLAKVLREAEDAFGRVKAKRPREKDHEIAEHPTAIAAVRLLLLTGCRRGEILSLRWEEVDQDRSLLRFLDSKTGAKTVALNDSAAAIINGIPHVKDSPWVFPSPKGPTKHFVGLPKIWERLRKHAGLETMRDGGAFRLHDLRHNLASAAATEGMNLLQIGKLLGHRNQGTTARYAELVDAAQAKAANQVGATIARAMKAKRRQAK